MLVLVFLFCFPSSPSLAFPPSSLPSPPLPSRRPGSGAISSAQGAETGRLCRGNCHARRPRRAPPGRRRRPRATRLLRPALLQPAEAGTSCPRTETRLCGTRRPPPAHAGRRRADCRAGFVPSLFGASRCRCCRLRAAAERREGLGAVVGRCKGLGALAGRPGGLGAVAGRCGVLRAAAERPGGLGVVVGLRGGLRAAAGRPGRLHAAAGRPGGCQRTIRDSGQADGGRDS